MGSVAHFGHNKTLGGSHNSQYRPPGSVSRKGNSPDRAQCQAAYCISADGKKLDLREAQSADEITLQSHFEWMSGHRGYGGEQRVRSKGITADGQYAVEGLSLTRRRAVRYPAAPTVQTNTDRLDFHFRPSRLDLLAYYNSCRTINNNGEHR
jgi:hypothetical protein